MERACGTRKADRRGPKRPGAGPGHGDRRGGAVDGGPRGSFYSGEMAVGLAGFEVGGPAPAAKARDIGASDCHPAGLSRGAAIDGTAGLDIILLDAWDRLIGS